LPSASVRTRQSPPNRLSRKNDDRVKAVRAKDIDALASSYAPDVLAFDVIGPLQSTGSDAIGKRLEEWFSSFQGPIDFEIRDLTIAASYGLSGVGEPESPAEKSICGQIIARVIARAKASIPAAILFR
jgi:hypothetical protein